METYGADEMTFYVTTHKDEDRNFLTGEPFDATTEHMVKHRGYDLHSLRVATQGTNQVIWRMDRTKNGYVFGEVV